MADEGTRLVAIHLRGRRGDPVQSVDHARAQAGRGLEGDRQFDKPKASADDPGTQVTLIEAEAIEGLLSDTGIDLPTERARRNLVTRGVSLNNLVGQEFQVGPVRMRGVRLCHPCSHLEATTTKGVLKGLADRGGLRAEIVEGGDLRVGDPIVAPPGVPFTRPRLPG